MTLSEPDGAGWIGHWSPGIGDPSVMGWLTVVLYAVGAWQCYRIAAEQAHRFAPREVMLWRLLALGLLALGINKQLDLQTAFTEIGRMVAAHQGWYERRHEVQINFIYGVVAFAELTAAALAVLARKSHPATISAVTGGMCLLAFIIAAARWRSRSG
jgi:hypothetical protein